MIRFRTFGALELTDSDGRELLSILAQPKRLALLAYLARPLPGTFHRRDTLLGIFWPEADQQHARDSLRQAVRHLRRSLPPGAIIGRGDEELAVDGALLWLDAAAFERELDAGALEAAVDLYRGDLLAGFYLPDVPEFERWLERERTRLRGRAVEALWTLAEREERAGARDRAAKVARRALELCPQDEGNLRRLLTLLVRSGDRASAVRAYEAFARRLAEDCGVEPAVETRAIVAALHRTDSSALQPGAILDSPADRSRPESEGVRPEEELAVAGGAGGGTAALPRPSWPTRRRRTAAMVGVGLVLLLVAGLAGVGFARLGADVDRVLVVPFENRTGDSSLDPLGSWASDWIAQRLGVVEGIEVLDGSVDGADRAAIQHSEGRILELGRRSRARATVLGAYYRDGDSIRFQVRIRDGRGATLGGAIPAVSAHTQRPYDAVRKVGERVAGAVAAHFDPWNRAIDPGGGHPPLLSAYSSWIAGGEEYARRDFRAAWENMVEAAALDSTFVGPLVWAASADLHLQNYARADSLLAVADARRSRLRPLDRHLLDLKRASLRGDRAAEYRAARQMVTSAPASEIALYQFAKTAMALNRPGEAVDALLQIERQASVMDWDAYGLGLTKAYHLAGMHRLELVEARRIRAGRPELLRAIGEESRALAALARTEEAIRLLDRALTLAPQSGMTPADVSMEVADELSAHGHTEAAGRALERAFAWYEGRPAAEQETEAHRFGLARALYRAGRWDAAETLFRQLSAESLEEVEYVGFRGVLAVRRGNGPEADRIDATLARMDQPYLRGRNTFWRARIAALAGRPDEATSLLRTALAEGQEHGLALHTVADFAPLRRRPSFKRLLQPRG